MVWKKLQMAIGEKAPEWILSWMPPIRPYNKWKLECTKPLKGHGDKKIKYKWEGRKIIFQCICIQILRSLAKLLCSPEKLCIILHNLYILQANTKIIWGMQKFCKQTQNKYTYKSNQIFEQNVCSHLIFPSLWRRILFSKEITTVIILYTTHSLITCYILTWCALNMVYIFAKNECWKAVFELKSNLCNTV